MRLSAGGRLSLLLAVLGIGLTACAGGDRELFGTSVLAGFETGAPMEEVIRALPQGPRPPSPTVNHGYEADRYLLEGVFVDVLWLYQGGDPAESQLLRSEANPVVFRDGALDGWGWAHFDQRVEDWKIRKPSNAGG